MANLDQYKSALSHLCHSFNSDVASLMRSHLATTVKENDIHMTMDPTRRGLLRVVTLAGIGAALLPGTTLLPIAVASPKPPPLTSPVMVKGWLLNASDR